MLEVNNIMNTINSGDNNAADLRKIIDSIPCGVLQYRMKDYKIITINQATLKILGYSSLEELEADGFDGVAKTVVDEDKKKIKDIIKSITERDKKTAFEYRVKHPDSDDIVYCYGEGFIFENKDGDIIVQRSIMDISEQVYKNKKVKYETETSGRQQQTMINRIIDEFPIGIFAYTLPERKEIMANTEAHKLLGHDCSDGKPLAGENVFANVLSEDVDNIYETVKNLKEPGDKINYTYRVRMSGGNVITVESFSMLNELSDGSRYILSSMLDITNYVTERARYEEALLADCISAMGFDVTENVLDRECIKKSVSIPNEKYEHIFPCRYEDLTEDMFEKIDEDEIQLQIPDSYRKYFTADGLIDAYNSGKTNIDFQMYINSRDKYVRQNILLSEAPNGHIFAISMTYDVTSAYKEQITRTKELNNAYKAVAEANHSKSEFIANMSRDIRVPMNAIVGMTQIALKNLDNKDRILECLTKIGVSSGRLLSLINEVIDMNKFETGILEFTEESIDLVEILDNCYTMVAPEAKEHNVEMIIHEDERPKNRYLIGSPLHLKQVFLNIASNAIRYNKPGGKFECSCIENVIDENNVEYKFIFADTGVGMSEEFLKNIFVPFSFENANAYSKYKGTGLGLYIVKLIVERMNGEISVESKEGVGSTFTVRIPFKIDEKKVKQNSIGKENMDISGSNILLVEDSEIDMEIMQYMLEYSGVKVTTAVNGMEAMRIISEKSDEEMFDLVFMDVMMPIMDGYTTTRAIRASSNEAVRNMPIIAISANALDEDIEKCKMSGMNEHIAKPFDMDKVIAAVFKYTK